MWFGKSLFIKLSAFRKKIQNRIISQRNFAGNPEILRRITDHRIGLSIFDLDGFMNGNLHKMIEELQLVANTEKLKESEVF